MVCLDFTTDIPDAQTRCQEFRHKGSGSLLHLRRFVNINTAYSAVRKSVVNFSDTPPYRPRYPPPPGFPPGRRAFQTVSLGFTCSNSMPREMAARKMVDWLTLPAAAICSMRRAVSAGNRTATTLVNSIL